MSSTARLEVNGAEPENDFQLVLRQFKQFDLDGNGTIEEWELAEVLSNLDPKFWNPGRVTELLAAVDRTGNGIIKFEEFLSWAWSDEEVAPQLLGVQKVPKQQPKPAEDEDEEEVFILGEQEDSRRITDFYTLGDQLGEGAFATVYRAKFRSTGEAIAVKSVVKDEMSKIRKQVPDAELAERRKNIQPKAPGVLHGSRFLGTLECPENGRISRLEVQGSFSDMGYWRKVVTVRGGLRRDGELLYEVDLFEITMSTVGKAWKGTALHTFSARDGLVYRAQRGDVYEFKVSFHYEETEANAHPEQPPPSDNDDDGTVHFLRIDEFTARLFAPAQASEFVILKSLDHPNIIKVWDVFEDFRHLHLCMELCEGGEVFDAILEAGHFTESQAVIFAKQICSAVHYMHRRRLVHRDLRLENLMFLDSHSRPMVQNTIKIIDLGLAKPVPHAETEFFTTKVGSPHYSAPEMLKGKYREECDVWSFGVICYILLAGRPPFDSETDIGVMQHVRDGNYKFDGEEWEPVSDRAKDFISHCLVVDRSKRTTAIKALDHAWLKHGAAQPKQEDDAADQGERTWKFRHTAGRRLTVSQVPNMRSFWGLCRLKRLAYSVLAPRRVAGAGLSARELREIFEELDVDHNGEITFEELRQGLEKVGLGMGVGPSGWRTWLERTFQAESRDVVVSERSKERRVRYEAFLASCCDRLAFEQEEVCWKAFSLFDKDRDGHISLGELGEVLRDNGLQGMMGADSARSLMEKTDLNLDGRIDFWEFVEGLRSTPSDPLASTEVVDGFFATLEHLAMGDLELVASPHTRGRLVIKHVVRGGAAWFWNNKCASQGLHSQTLNAGDEIVSVNDIVGEAKGMLAEITACVTEDRRIQLHIVRWAKKFEGE